MICLAVISFSVRTYILNSLMGQMCIGLVLQPYVLHSKLVQIRPIILFKFQSYCRLFRQAQVFINAYNPIYQRSSGYVLMFLICEGILSLYSSISLGKYLSAERRIIFGYTALTTSVCVTTIYGMLSVIYKDSKSKSKSWSSLGNWVPLNLKVKSIAARWSLCDPWE